MNWVSLDLKYRTFLFKKSYLKQANQVWVGQRVLNDQQDVADAVEERQGLERLNLHRGADADLRRLR